MSITSSVSVNEDELTIGITGRFDFSAHQAFRNAYENTSINAKIYTIDMSQTTYIDSSALGLLLLLRDHAGGDSSNIRIVNTSPDVRKILTISNFEQLFSIN